MQAWTPPAKMRKARPCRGNRHRTGYSEGFDLLLSAKNPVITTESGREPRLRGAGRTGRTAVIPVVESRVSTVANFPKDNPLHQGFDIEPVLASAEPRVGLVRSRVPWIRRRKAPSTRRSSCSMRLLQDAHGLSEPACGHVSRGDVPSSLRMLAQAFGLRAPTKPKSRPAGSFGKSSRAERGRLAKCGDQVPRKQRNSPCEPVRNAGQVMPGNTIYVTRPPSHRALIHKFVQNAGMLSYVRVPAGSASRLEYRLASRSPVRIARWSPCGATVPFCTTRWFRHWIREAREPAGDGRRLQQPRLPGMRTIIWPITPMRFPRGIRCFTAKRSTVAITSSWRVHPARWNPGRGSGQTEVRPAGRLTRAVKNGRW